MTKRIAEVDRKISVRLTDEELKAKLWAVLNASEDLIFYFLHSENRHFDETDQKHFLTETNKAFETVLDLANDIATAYE